MNSDQKIAVVGLGYVGLPLCVAFGKGFDSVLGYDISKDRIEELRQGIDSTFEVSSEDLKLTKSKFSSDINDLKNYNFIVVAVPTPVDRWYKPDLSLLRHAALEVGQVISQGSIVVFESTVYPGATEEVCGPIIEKASGLKRGKGFFLGYSPERINPGDKEHRIEDVVKVISGEDEDTLKIIHSTYGKIIRAGLFSAASIKVAEAAKVIENTQRDLNIALMNELAMIFEKLNISTADVLKAAETKWNFLRFRPGLVGGHCIGVDPYYLTYKAQEVGYNPEVILAGRRINENVGPYIAQRLAKCLFKEARTKARPRPQVGILGLTFKENVPDLRNSRVPDIYNELAEYGVDCHVHDPLCNPADAQKEYGIKLSSLEDFHDLDAVIIAVSHNAFLKIGSQKVRKMIHEKGIVYDVKSLFGNRDFLASQRYFAL